MIHKLLIMSRGSVSLLRDLANWRTSILRAKQKAEELALDEGLKVPKIKRGISSISKTLEKVETEMDRYI